MGIISISQKNDDVNGTPQIYLKIIEILGICLYFDFVSKKFTVDSFTYQSKHDIIYM